MEVKAHNSLEPLVLFALSDADDNTSRPFNRGGIVDLLLLRTQLALLRIYTYKSITNMSSIRLKYSDNG